MPIEVDEVIEKVKSKDLSESDKEFKKTNSSILNNLENMVTATEKCINSMENMINLLTEARNARRIRFGENLESSEKTADLTDPQKQNREDLKNISLQKNLQKTRF